MCSVSFVETVVSTLSNTYRNHSNPILCGCHLLYRTGHAFPKSVQADCEHVLKELRARNMSLSPPPYYHLKTLSTASKHRHFTPSNQRGLVQMQVQNFGTCSSGIAKALPALSAKASTYRARMLHRLLLIPSKILQKQQSRSSPVGSAWTWPGKRNTDVKEIEKLMETRRHAWVAKSSSATTAPMIGNLAVCRWVKHKSHKLQEAWRHAFCTE